MGTVKQVLGYELLGNWSRANAGRSEHNVATREGARYFVKRFLEPKFPSSGSSETQQRLLKACFEFENKTNEILNLVGASTGLGGSLVAPVEFFRDGASYYKIFEWIDPECFSLDQVFTQELSRKLSFCATMCRSLDVLHRHNFVHGDIKPSNIIVTRQASGNFMPRLIDFDDGYFQNSPPSHPEFLYGTPEYYAPETHRFVIDGDTSSRGKLSVKADIFPLGLILYQIVMGADNISPEENITLGAFLAEGGKFDVVRGIEDLRVKALLEVMLHELPEVRPSAAQAAVSLKRISAGVKDEYLDKIVADTKVFSGVKRGRRVTTEIGRYVKPLDADSSVKRMRKSREREDSSIIAHVKRAIRRLFPEK